MVGMAAAAGLQIAGMSGQAGGHLNPTIDLIAANKAVFGVGVPTAGGGGRGRRGGQPADAPQPPPPPTKTPADLAKETLAYRDADYFFIGAMEGASRFDASLASFTQYMDALAAAGPLGSSPRRLLAPMNLKSPNIDPDPALATQRIGQQLNAGAAIISFVEVDTAEELAHGIAAMRFTSRGGTRAEEIGQAAKYWGVSEKEYRTRADVWPLNPNGELVAWAIVETMEGLANVREIAQVKGLGVLVPGAGSLRSVTSRTNEDGTRTPDPAAHEAAIQKVLAACKEFKVPCGYPVTAKDVETRLQQGFTVAIGQAFNDANFEAVRIGKKAAGR
jgi:2-keto-3-deoxy-L-rhamnonate aldolase RhmA